MDQNALPEEISEVSEFLTFIMKGAVPSINMVQTYELFYNALQRPLTEEEAMDLGKEIALTEEPIGEKH